MLSQERAPIYEALQEFEKKRVVPFDVPGHKRGRGNPELAALLGEQCVRMDVNSMKPLDNLCHPVSVIRDAEQLAAEAFGAAHAFLMVGGTTSAVQAMILSSASRGEKIILPRNVHRSVMGAMVLCGAVPVYVDPACDDRLGIPLGMRREINQIGGYYAFSEELVNGDSVFAFDKTKLSVNTLDIGLAGIEVYDLLRDEYDIQIEFGDLGNILAYLSIGDRPREIERLVGALAEVRRRFGKEPDAAGLMRQEYIEPQVDASPQEAFYAPKESLPLDRTPGHICSEFVMCYPPGIPILAPGERITRRIVDYIKYAKAKGCSMTGPEDPDIERLNVLSGLY